MRMLLLAFVLAAGLYGQEIITPRCCGGGGGSLTVDGAGEATNLNSTTPAAPANAVNVDWQVSGADTSANLLLSDIGTATWGAGSGIVWTFNAGASDPTITFGSALVTFGATAVTFDGSATDLKVLSTGQLVVDADSGFGLSKGLCFGACTAGIGLVSADVVGIYNQTGVLKWSFSGGEIQGIATGTLLRPHQGDTAAAPAYGWPVDGANEGMYYIAAGNFGFTVNGNKFAEFGGTQTFQVQDTTATTGDTELIIKEGAGQAAAALQVINNADAALFSVNVGGGFGGPGRALASLGTPANGSIEYCTDCLKGSDPCSASSTGAMAMRVAAAWQCM